jgi:hypothetical protein
MSKGVQRKKYRMNIASPCPIIKQSGWSDVGRSILCSLLFFVDDPNDIKSMALTCKRWRHTILKDKDFDKWYWKARIIDFLESRKEESKSVGVDIDYELIWCYVEREYNSCWRLCFEEYLQKYMYYNSDAYEDIYTPNQIFMKYVWYTMYYEWLAYRLEKSRKDKTFSDYLDIYALGYCKSCERQGIDCKVYQQLEPQRMDCTFQPNYGDCADLGILFESGKREIFSLRGECDSERNYHQTDFAVWIISRKNGKVYKERMDSIQTHFNGGNTDSTILSKRQRKKFGKILWNDETKYLQPGKHSSVIGHSYARNTYSYNRQSKYESIRNNSTSLANMCYIGVSEVFSKELTISLKDIFKLEQEKFSK